ncbi:MAG: hypothetical protein U0797_23350 [Gemmataceae bacterium]
MLTSPAPARARTARARLSPAASLVADLNLATIGSSPYGFTAVGKIKVFAAADGVNGVELWQSDGTAAGTKLAQRSDDPMSVGYQGDNLVVFAGKLFFTGDDGEYGNELWALPL